MHRFYLPPEVCRGPVVTLTGREAHHASQVLRVRTGERVTVLNGVGGVFFCDVARSGKSNLELAIVEESAVPRLPCAITLLQGVPKGKLIENIIQKATELGVARVVPLLTERVVTQLDADSAEAKAEKWRWVAVEAIKQSGNAWLPRIEPPQSIQSFLQRAERFELPLVASLHDKPMRLRRHVEEYVRSHGARPGTACVWVGPEGDFTREEMDAIQAMGARPITLGRLVLRVETATTCCLAMMNDELNTVEEPAHD